MPQESPSQYPPVHLLRRLAALIVAVVAASVSHAMEKAGKNADESSVPNIVYILADDKN